MDCSGSWVEQKVKKQKKTERNSARCRIWTALAELLFCFRRARPLCSAAESGWAAKASAQEAVNAFENIAAFAVKSDMASEMRR